MVLLPCQLSVFCNVPSLLLALANNGCVCFLDGWLPLLPQCEYLTAVCSTCLSLLHTYVGVDVVLIY